VDTLPIAPPPANARARKLARLRHTGFQARYLAKDTASQGWRSVTLACNHPLQAKPLGAPDCRTQEGRRASPDPNHPYPLPEHQRYCVFVRPTITSEKIVVGEYTYYDATRDTGRGCCILLSRGTRDRLIPVGQIARVSSLKAAGTRRLMNSSAPSS
jgi:hypothetical protein